MPSSVISFWNYNEALALLTIGFVSGAVYSYLDVPQKVVQQLERARSKGYFFNKMIRERYSFRKET